MPTLTTNTPQVAYLMERDWRLRHLIEAVGDLSYEVSGSAFEHVAHSVIEQMLSMKVGRTIEGRLRELCGGGIGRWAADMFLIFYLERPDILPVEDGAVRQVFRWLYSAPLTDDNVREVVCSLWKPYSSTAVRYMYRALNSGLLNLGGHRAPLTCDPALLRCPWSRVSWSRAVCEDSPPLMDSCWLCV